MKQTKGSGQILRDAREQAGLSIADMSEQLKISERVLRALEEEQVNVLPARPYVQGYIKSYCRLLNLYSEEIIQDYPVLEQSFVERDEKIGVTLSPPISRNTKRILLFMVIATLSGISGYSVWYYWQTISEKVASFGQEPRSVDKQTNEVEGESSWQITETQNFQGTKLTEEVIQEEQKEILPPKDASLASLKFVFTGNCWVEVLDENGERLLYALGKEGEIREIQGKSPFEVTIGFLPNVDIYLDNKKMQFSSMTNSVYFKTIINR